MGRFVQEAVRRRIPQLAGVYLAAGWGLLEFSGWATTQFSLSAPWSRIAFAALSAGLIPYLFAVWRISGRANS